MKNPTELTYKEIHKFLGIILQELLRSMKSIHIR